MLSTIGNYLTGRAAKAGVAALTGLIGAPGAVAGVDALTGTGSHEMTLLGYVAIGALGGLANWIAIYFKANKPTEKQRSQGLF